MSLKLHRCGTPWKFGPCWRVQKALDDQRIPYEVVRGPWRPKERVALIEGTGQPLSPAIQFEDGGRYREESQDMARTWPGPFGRARLIEKELGSVPAS
jgi:hypothetical protein